MMLSHLQSVALSITLLALSSTSWNMNNTPDEDFEEFKKIHTKPNTLKGALFKEMEKRFEEHTDTGDKKTLFSCRLLSLPGCKYRTGCKYHIGKKPINAIARNFYRHMLREHRTFLTSLLSDRLDVKKMRRDEKTIDKQIQEIKSKLKVINKKLKTFKRIQPDGV